MNAKKFYVFVLAVAAAFAFCAGSAVLADSSCAADATGGSCGDDLTWSYDSGSLTLTISGTGKMTDFSSEKNVPWQSYRDKIYDVVLPSGLTSIGSYAFKGCKQLTSIDIPNGVMYIGQAAFKECEKLEKIVMPGQLVQIGKETFANCKNLSALTIASTVTAIGDNAFKDIGRDSGGTYQITVYDWSGKISAKSYGLPDKSRVLHPSSCTVNFDATTGTLIGESQTSAVYGQAITITTSAEHQTYTLSGWYTSADSTGHQVKSGDIWREDGDTVTLYAHYTSGSKFMVLFNANGGVLNGEPVAYATDQEAFNFTQTATRAGYSVSTWNTSADGTGTDVAKGYVWDLGADQTLYAQWAPMTFTVTFDPQGGTITEATSGEDFTATATYGAAFDFPSMTVTRTGYTLQGWYTQENGAGVKFESGDTWTTADDATLYAYWTPNSVNVIFNADGGTFDGVQATITKSETYNTAYVFPDVEPTKTGYTFAGWWTTASTPVQIKSGDIVDLTADATFKAHWTGNTYYVTFDPNGGTITGDTQFPAVFGSAFTFSVTATRTGYEDVGWFTADGTEITSGSTWAISENTTLYMHWTPIEITVTFKNGDTTVDEIDQTYDAKYTLPTTPTPEAGYQFGGWWNGSEQITADTVVKATSDFTATAKWNPIIYTVTFSGNGGTVSGDTIVTIAYGSTLTITQSASRTGYDCGGKWYYKDGDDDVQFVSGSAWEIAADTTLYPIWTAITITVTFEDNGTQVGDPIEETYDGYYTTPGSQSKDGYTWGGWWYGDKQLADDGTTKVEETADFTATAKWIANEYTVTFNPSGGVRSGAETAQAIYDSAFSFDQSATRTGYDFGGWYTGEGGTGTKIESGKDWTIASDTVLYVKWTGIEITVYFDPANGGSVITTTQIFGDKYVLPTGDDPEKEYFVFNGWWYADEEITDSKTVNVTSGFTATADWLSEESYEVYFEANGGEITSGEESVTAYSGQAFVFDTVAKREGYEFAGWWTTEDDSGTLIESGDVWKTYTEYGDTLYAHWTGNTFYVTFVYEDGETDDEKIQQTVGGTYKLPDTPSRTGYVFEGWWTAETEEAEPRIITASTPVSPADAADFTVYARWMNAPVSVTFDYNYDDGPDDVIITERYNAYYVLPEEPKRAGYNFGGWWTSGETTQITDDTLVDTLVAFTAYAKWTEKSDIEVTFVNGAMTVTISQTFGSYYVLPSPTPTKDGYTFDGWFKSDGMTKITSSTPVDTPESFTVYAKWTAITFDLTCVDAGTGGSTTDITQTYDEKYILPAERTWAGHIFGGWWTGEGGTGDQITSDTVVKATEAFTVYAYWTTVVIDVTFDNEGTTKVIKQTYGEKYELPDQPTKTGYTFGGWWTAGETPVQITADDDVASVVDFTVYAKWTANECVVTFDPTPGALPSGAEATVTATYDQPFVFTQYAELKGYTFGGWYNGEVRIISGDLWKIDAETLTLTAKLTAIVSNVFFDANGGTVTGGSASITAVYDQVINFTQKAERDGYKFDGWIDPNGEIVVSGTTVWEFYNDTTLTAKWTENTITVTFDANGGTLTGDATAETKCGKTFTFTQTATRDGYRFDGWYTEDSVRISSGMVWSIPTDTTVYAKWTILEYTVTFDPAGGTLSGEETMTATVGTPFKFDQTASKTGFTFLGWFTAPGSSGTQIIRGDNWTIASDTTLYAHWQANVYTVSFNAMGGTLTGDVTASATYGERFSFTQTAAMTGSTFEGWYTQTGGAGTKIVSGQVWNIPADTTVFAKWTVNTYTVTYDANGGTLGEGDNPVTVTFGATFTIGMTAERTGYAFAGWWSDPVNGTKYADSFAWNITDNVTMFAHWTKGQTAVTFYTEQGTISGSTTATAYYGEKFVFSQKAVRDGYKFDGWYTSGDVRVVSGQVWKITDAAVTLHAHWTARVFTVTFDANGGTLTGDLTAKATYGDAFTFDQYATLEGYRFDGWFTALSGGVKVVSGETWATSKNVMLYAHWTDMSRTIDVTFMDGSSEIGTIAEPLNGKYGLPAQPSKGSLTFMGWFTETGGQGKQVTEQTTVTILDATTLYAYWTLTVTFMVDGAPYGEPITQEIGKNYILPETEPTKSGVSFGGWYTALYGAGSEITADTAVAESDGAVLYGAWTISVAFYDGDNQVSGSPVTEFVGAKYTFPTQPTKENCAFAGWFTQLYGEGNEITTSTTVAVGDSTSLYAKWTKSVTYKSNGSTVETVTETVGKTYAVPDQPSKPASGFSFLGWYTDLSSTDTQVTTSTVVQATDPLTILAMWKMNVKFYSNSEDFEAAEQILGLAVSLPATPDPPSSDFKFKEWNTVAVGTGSKIGTTVTASIAEKYYAVWTVDVSFYSQGLQVGDAITEVLGAAYTTPSPTPPSGFSFKEWNTSADGTGTTMGSKVTVGASTTFNAVWTVSVSFYSQGAPVGSAITQILGAAYSVPTTPSGPDGCTFKEWNTKADGSGTTIGSTVAVGDAVTYHAVWTYDVNFDVDGSITTLTQTVGAAYNCPTPTKGDYTLEWRTGASGAGDVIGTTVAVGGPTDFVANWKISVKFMNGDTEVSGSPIVEYLGAAYVLPSEPTPPSEYHDFDGWYTASEGGTIIGTTVTEGDVVVYYAHWTQQEPT